MKKQWVKWFYREEKVIPYTHLAALYDKIMDHVDYNQWANFIVALFQRFGSDICRVVDGGCGTGSLLKVLHQREIEITGFDRSIDMIRIAREKVRAPLWVGDLRHFSVNKKWDAFLCLYDTIQYFTVEEIQKLFCDVGRILIPGGLFIFDAVTKEHILRYWANYTEKVESGNLEMLRRSWYVKKTQSQHTEFEIFDCCNEHLYREHHIQYIYPLETFIKVSGESGLKLIGQFQDFTLNPGNEKADRIHFVFKREPT